MFNHIIITGASSGLGMEMARLYARPGVTMGLIGRNHERLEKVAALCTDSGANISSISLDIRQRKDLQAWIMDFDTRFPVDLVIANAGITHTTSARRIIESDDVIKDIFDTNFFGVTHTLNPLLKSMRGRGGGAAAVISSLSAYRGMPLFPAYAASKAAAKSYYEGIRGMLSRDNVHLTLACPGFIKTPMLNDQEITGLLQMDAAYAARRIKSGIEKQQPIISFPLLHLAGLKFLSLLPERLADRILLKFCGF